MQDDHGYYFAEPHVWVPFIFEVNFILIASHLAIAKVVKK